MKSLQTPSFYKTKSLISVALRPSFSVGRIDYVNSHGNVKAGTTVLLVRFLFLLVLPSKAVFIYIVRSSRFIPSPCFILSPESAFYT